MPCLHNLTLKLFPVKEAKYLAFELTNSIRRGKSPRVLMIIAATRPAGFFAAAFLALWLAGCASSTHSHFTHVPDWESEETTLTSSHATMAASAPAPAQLPPTPAFSVQPPVPTLTGNWISLERWCRENGLSGPERVNLTPLPTYALNTPHGDFLFCPGSQLAHWNGLEVRLGFAPQLTNGQPYLHALELKKTLEPLLHGAGTTATKSPPIVVLDPGHGGQNSGTKSVLGKHYEKEFTLDWARRLESLLTQKGLQVFLTRTNDSDLALSNRVAFAEAHKADLFLSLHFNSAAPNETEAGLETYCLTPAGMTSSVTRGFSDDPTLTFPNNAFDAQNLRLAFQVHRALLQANGNRDRGVRRARFPGVLRGQQRPAILVEGGYLSNPPEARLIADPAYRQRLAEAVARAVIEGSEVGSRRADSGGQKTEARTNASGGLSQNTSPP
jgi:N-acetylmuramoyl-L-alanine amidase